MRAETAQERFASSCSEAMFGYANAATAAYWAMTRQTLSFWSDTARSFGQPAASAESWFKPERPARSALLPLAGAPAYGWDTFRDDDNPFSAFMPAPMRIWLSLLPLQGPPAAWPMAYAMLCAGAPRSVAWPTARANAALMDATEVATQTMASAFSAYRSDGGHATMHAVWKHIPVSLMWLTAFGAAPIWQSAMRSTWPSV